MRARNFLIFGVAIAVVVALLLTDPDKGASTGFGLLAIAGGFIAVAAAHFARKGLFDYVDMGELYDSARMNPIASAVVFLSVCIVLASLLFLFGGLLRV